MQKKEGKKRIFYSPMTGGAGHIFSMIASLRENRKHLRDKKAYHEERIALYAEASVREPLRFADKMTPEEHRFHRKELRRLRRRSRITLSVVLLLIGALCTMGIWLLLRL